MGSESSGSSFRVVITMMRNFPSTSIVILNMMEYPPRGWSLSFYEVVDILFTIANAIIVSVPIVAPPPDPWYLPMLIIGPCMSIAWKNDVITMSVVFLSCLWIFTVALAVGLLVYYLGYIGSDGPMNRGWSCFAMLPFTLLLSLGLPEANTKFSFPGQAMMMVFAYYPIAFYMSDPYQESKAMIILVIFICGVAFVQPIVWKLLHLTPSKGPNPIDAFLYASADFFDILTGYFNSADEHVDVIRSAGGQYNNVCINIASVKNIPPAVSEVVWNIAGEMFALYKCLTEDRFDRMTQGMLWDPLASNILDIRSAVGRVLRKTADGDPSAADADIQNKIAAAVKRAGEVSNKLSYSHADGTADGEQFDRAQITRFYYAFESILSLAALTEKYRQLKVEENAEVKAKKGKEVSFTNKFITIVKAIGNGIITWLKRPLFNDLKGFSDLLSRLRIPLRTALTMNILITLLTIWGDHRPTLRLHAFWAVIPQYVLYLPTAGASLLKGTRRIVGTICAGLLAVLCLYLHPTSKAAFFVENLLLVIGAKVLMTCKAIGYAAYVAQFTWVVVGWGSTLMPMTQSEQFMTALWRFVFTVCGVLLVFLISCLIFPNFAAARLNEASKDSIMLVADCVTPLLIGQWKKDYEADDELQAALIDKWEHFGQEAFNLMALRINQMDDAAAEIVGYGTFHLVPSASKLIRTKQREISDVQRSGLVLFSSCLVLHPHYKGQFRERVIPFMDRIISFSESVRSSSARISQMMESGAAESTADDDNLHVEVQRCLEAMHDLQNDIVEDFLTNSDRVGDAYAYMTLLHAAYALCDFATSWEQLENALLGERVPCELTSESVPLPNDIPLTSTLRGRTPSASRVS